jgi:benzaldehyde dehydrogenase (NAD)
MALMDEAVWRGKIYSGGWVGGAGGDAAVIEPATGQEIGHSSPRWRHLAGQRG